MSRPLRRVVLGLAALTLAGGAGAPLAGGAPAPLARGPMSRPGPAHLLVYAQEWSLWPSSGSVRAGTIDVELWNRGQDAHDLRVRRLSAAGQMVGAVDGTVRITSSGAISHAVWRLKPGRYELYCSMPGHMAMGMRAVITIRAWSRPSQS